MTSLSSPTRAREPDAVVSVITPCHNSEAFLAETIAAVKAQSYRLVEHIIVDDASTDGSWSVIANSQGIIPVQLDQRRGAPHARNRAVQAARGGFLMFLDADDLIAPETIASLVAAVREKPDAIGVCRWRRLCRKGESWVAMAPGIPFPPPADGLRGWLEGAWVPPCALLWRRDVYDRTGGWNESLSANQDGDLVMRALCDGARIVFAPGGEGFYRFHGTTRLSVSSSSSAEHLQSRISVLEQLEERLKLQGKWEQYASAVGIAYYRLASPAFPTHPALAAECQRRGEKLAGPMPISRTWGGRLLVRLLGLQRKERIASALARLGAMTPARRRLRELGKLHESE